MTVDVFELRARAQEADLRNRAQPLEGDWLPVDVPASDEVIRWAISVDPDPRAPLSATYNGLPLNAYDGIPVIVDGPRCERAGCDNFLTISDFHVCRQCRLSPHGGAS